MNVRPTAPVVRRAAAALVATAALGTLSGCGAGAVDAEDLQTRVSEELERSQGTAPEGVDCPEDLTAEVGETVTCVTTFSDGDYDTEIEVTEVEGNQVNFSIEVAGEAS